MTRAERKVIRKQRAELNALARRHPAHTYIQEQVRKGLAILDAAERDDPRPSLPLRLRLCLSGVDAG